MHNLGRLESSLHMVAEVKSGYITYIVCQRLAYKQVLRTDTGR
jgi:hypothetical protein